jgi:chromosome partitioning protein
MAFIISIALRKGGSGKTTTATNLAAGLVKCGRKVLLVDMDDQANASMCVGINPFGLKCSISTLFTDIHMRPEEAIVQTDFGLCVLPATQDLEDVGAGMKATSIKELRNILAPIRANFDYIIIDTQPGHSYLSLSALVASDYVLIPLQAHYLALEGLARILNDVDQVKHGDIIGSNRGHNVDLKVLGILPCMVQNTTISRAVVDKAKEDYPTMVLSMEIKLAIKFVNTSLEGSPMVISHPTSSGALEYIQLVEYVIDNLEHNRGKTN